MSKKLRTPAPRLIRNIGYDLLHFAKKDIRSFRLYVPPCLYSHIIDECRLPHIKTRKRIFFVHKADFGGFGCRGLQPFMLLPIICKMVLSVRMRGVGRCRPMIKPSIFARSENMEPVSLPCRSRGLYQNG